jgi:hypothetical protein
MTPISQPTFAELVAAYENSAAGNDQIYSQLHQATWADPLLSSHRLHVQDNQLGFGEAAFHALWLSILQEAARKFGIIRALEIGVFKGQAISLWALISLKLQLKIEISAVTPLCGQPIPKSPFLNRIRYRIDRKFREKVENGNFYDDADYSEIVRKLFLDFGTSFDDVTLYRGFSSDPGVLKALEGKMFNLVYVDGDHTYKGALEDFENYGPKVTSGGWLVVDDAGCGLDGTRFWKGHPAVSAAVKIVPSLGFKNVLNVAHLRIFERVT